MNRLQRLWYILTAPRAADADEMRQEYMTKVILIILSAVAFLATISLVIGWSVGLTSDSPVEGILASLLFAGGWTLAHRGRWHLGSCFPPILVFLFALYDNYLEGIGASAMLYYAIAILLTAMLQGIKAQWGMLAFSLVAYLGFGVARTNGYLPPAPAPEAAFGSWAASVSFAFIAIALLQWFSTSQYQRALAQSRAYAAELEHINEERQQAEKEARRHNRELGTLYKAATAISSALSQDIVLQTVAEQMVHALDATGCALSNWDRERNVIETLADYNKYYPDQANLPGTIYDLNEYPTTRRVLEAGQPAVIQCDDPTADERELALMKEEGTLTLVMLPLVARDWVVGLMELYNDVEKREYTPEEIRLAESLAAQAAIAIRNAQLYERAQQEIAERMQAEEALLRHTGALAQLNRLGQELTATLSLQQIAEQLSRVATEIIGTESVSAWLLDAEAEQEGELVCWASSDHIQRSPECSPVGLRLHPDQGIAGWVVQNRESVIVHDAPNDPRFYPGIEKKIGYRTHSLLAVPLRVRNAIIGVLQMLNKLRGEFTPEDLALAETLAASAAIAIDNARLVEELRHYATELESQNAELDAFAHTVAHDLKNPLSVLIGYSDMLVVDGLQLSDEEFYDSLRRIRRKGQKMTDIINELLLLASVRKVEEVETSRLDMAGIVAEAQGRLSDMIAEFKAQIILPDEWPVATGYGPWIEEVWANYISNALKYGGTPPCVSLGATEQPDGRIRFWVQDNGHGLTPEEQAQLFTQFTRLHRVRVEGHGLGLSIVQRIVEKLSGEVGVESEPGQGSTFYFTLPATSVG